MTLKKRNQMIVDHMSLARAIACNKHKQIKYISIDEMTSAAYFGLVDAACKYKPTKGEFEGYAKFRIVGEIQDYLRGLGFGSKKSKRFLSLGDQNENNITRTY